jgi:ribosome biogenesis GTPase
VFIDSARLRELGWSSFFDDPFVAQQADGLVPARVAVQHRGAFVLYAEAGELWAELAGRLAGAYVRHDPGKLAFNARIAAALPAIGDWVAASVRADEGRATIRGVLPRRTQFSRKDPWTTDEQVLAANVDTVFVACALAADAAEAPNVRRLERYLAMAHESGARPVVLLTKADLRVDARDQARALAPLAVDVVVTSALTGDGLGDLAPYLALGQTAVLIGSSGVGKSTLINALLGAEVLATCEIRRDGVGRHTTMRRELVELPGRGFLIDTPGLREIQLWDANEGFGASFGEIEDLAGRCRFRDCRHTVEPGCAVLAAVDTGALDASRLANFRRLARELEHLERKQSGRAAAERRRQYRALARSARREQ